MTGLRHFLSKQQCGLAALLFCVLLLSGCAQAPLKPPQALYDQVWQTVQTQFVDPQTNHQDWRIWRHRFDAQLQTMDDAYVAIDTMLASLNDDYSRLMRPKDLADQAMHIDAKLFGVGLQISVKNKQLTVVSPIPETPAAQAGLKALDVITHIDQQPTAGLAVDQAAERIRGPKNTRVSLRVMRHHKSFDVSLKRAEIKLKSVEVQTIPGYPNVGYVRLTTFISETAGQEMAEMIRPMAARKKALIIDLRNNYGGLLTNAVDISDMFLDEGTIVSILNRQQDRERFAALPGQVFNGPLAVLINGGSASASEIFAGAIQDHHRGTIVGSKSFGKGLVQKVIPLSQDAGLNLTVSRYRTPSGRDINTKGILPDVAAADDWLQPIPDPKADKQLAAALKALKLYSFE
jgi:carboxyl-terminal processing protease